MADYMIRATAADAQVRAFAVTARDMVETAKSRHGLSPVVTAALGRLLMGASMMGSMLKGEKDILTLQIDGDGPIENMTVTSDSAGNVKGYARNPKAMRPPNAKGKLDVGGAVGSGFLTVIKDMGMKEPYSSRIALQSGEIGEDLTYYFASSEQVPSCVALGVLMERDYTVKQAGGFIIQLMPFADDALIAKLEERIAALPSVTTLLENGKTPERILEDLLGDMELTITDKQPVGFVCNCSREKVEKVLLSLGRKEMQEIIDEGEEITLHCHFCNTDYPVGIERIKELYAQGIK